MERYRAWGYRSRKMTFIANGAPIVDTGVTDHQWQSEADLVPALRFFGQMTPSKGVEVLLQAAARLHDEDVEFILGFTATGLQIQLIASVWKSMPPLPTLWVYRGAYRPRMQ